MEKYNQEKQRTVSVIIPVRNRETRIAACIDSVLKQTYPVDEIVVVDDASEDATCEVVQSFNNSRIKLIQLRKKSGAQAARNAGIRASEGVYVSFLDSDDIWDKEKIEKQMKIMSGRMDLTLSCNCFVINERENTRVEWNVFPPGAYDYEAILKQPGPMLQGLLTNKTALTKVGYLDEKVVAMQEWDTFIRLSRITSMFHMKDPLFYYYQHEEEAISKNTRNWVEGWKYIVKKNKKDIIKHCGLLSLWKHYFTIVFLLLNRR